MTVRTARARLSGVALARRRGEAHRYSRAQLVVSRTLSVFGTLAHLPCAERLPHEAITFTPVAPRPAKAAPASSPPIAPAGAAPVGQHYRTKRYLPDCPCPSWSTVGFVARGSLSPRKSKRLEIGMPIEPTSAPNFVMTTKKRKRHSLHSAKTLVFGTKTDGGKDKPPARTGNARTTDPDPPVLRGRTSSRFIRKVGPGLPPTFSLASHGIAARSSAGPASCARDPERLPQQVR